jgi:ribosomal protein L22
LRRVAAFSTSPRSLFSTAATAPITNSQPPVPVSESTQPESKLELDAFGEPRVMAWLPKVKTSPRKLNLVAKLVRRMGLEQALMQLRFCSKKMADVVSKTIHDAKWNAVNNNVSVRIRWSSYCQRLVHDFALTSTAGLGCQPPIHRRSHSWQEQVHVSKHQISAPIASITKFLAHFML